MGVEVTKCRSIEVYAPPLTTLRRGGTKGRVVGYPPLLACRSKFFNNGRLPLSFGHANGVTQDLELVERPPGERKNKVVVLFVNQTPSAYSLVLSITHHVSHIRITNLTATYNTCNE